MIGALALAGMARAADNVYVLGGQVKIATTSAVVVTATNPVQMQGAAAHDAPVSGNPILIGMYGSTNPVTAVTQGDAVRAWADLVGRLVVMTGRPDKVDVSTNVTASGETVAISSPGASTSLYICKGSVHNAGSSNVTASFKNGSGGATFWKAELASEGGGSLFDFGGACKKITANSNFVVNLSGSGDVDVNVTEYFTGP